MVKISPSKLISLLVSLFIFFAIILNKFFQFNFFFTADNLDDVESAAFVRVVAVKDIKETVKNKIRHYYLNFYQELSNCVDSKVGYFKNKACPIKKNDVVTYALDMNLEKPFDTFFQMHDDNEFSLHFDFFGMNNAHLMCADVPAVFEKKF